MPFHVSHHPNDNGEAVGRYTSLPLRDTTLPLLEGPVITGRESACQSWRTTEVNKIDIFEAKTDKNSIMPISQHLNCCHTHEIASVSIPTAEAAFNSPNQRTSMLTGSC